ncbi:MAG: hypothetical protein V1906_03190 [Candidatus Woesearchaeota archaeon]
MLRKYLASAIIALSMLYPNNSLNSTERTKRTAYIYWDAYADEKYKTPTEECPNWKPCLESLVNNAEKIIAAEVKQSKRFRRHYDDIDFVLKSVGEWKSPEKDDKDLIMFPSYAISKFKGQKPIRANEVDLRMGFTLRAIAAYGYAEEIPGRFLIISTKKKTLDTLIHEAGHLFSLYHNAEKDDYMHPYTNFQSPKFSKEARAIMADSMISIINARGLPFRIEHNKIWLDLARLKHKPNLKITCNTGANNICVMHESKDYFKNTIVSVNPSGSLNVKYTYAKMDEKHDNLDTVVKMERLFDFLKSLGISETEEEAVFYKTKSESSIQWIESIINIEDMHFIKHYDHIIGYLTFHGFMPNETRKQFDTAKKISSLYGLKMFDVLYHYAKKE